MLPKVRRGESALIVTRNASATKPPGWFDRFLSRWWGKVMMGVGSLGAAAMTYLQFASSAVGERRSIRAFEWLLGLYELGGPWAAAAPFAVSGLGFLLVGVRQGLRQRGS